MTMKKAAAILIILSTAIALSAWGPAAADPRTRYPVEENTGGNRATYPYIVLQNNFIYHSTTLLG